MKENFRQVIKLVDQQLEQLKEQDISVGPLENALSRLKEHTDNITEIEDRIEAIREEVIKPVKGELQKAGRISRGSLWVGVLGIVLAAATLIWHGFMRQQPECRFNKAEPGSEVNIQVPSDAMSVLREMRNDLNFLTLKASGLTGEYVAKQDEILLPKYDKVPLLESEEHKVYANVDWIGEEVKDEDWIPLVVIEVYVDDQMLGTPGLKKMVSLIDNSGMAAFYGRGIKLSEGDFFEIQTDFIHRYEVLRIFRRSSKILTVADEKDGVLIRLKGS